MLRTSLLLAGAAVSVAAAVSVRGGTPATPVWADTWQAPFTERAGVVSFGNTTGYFWYDYPAGVSRTDRASGKHDRYCGSVKNVDSPCTHLVRNGTRYLWWPKLDDCCSCCDAAAGCGILRPDWIGRSNGSYVGRVTTSYGYVADKWLVKGLQSNYWYQTPAGAPVELDQDPDDFQYFNPNKYSSGAIPSSTFDLPSPSCTKKCSLFSICTVAAERGVAAAGGAPQ